MTAIRRLCSVSAVGLLLGSCSAGYSEVGGSRSSLYGAPAGAEEFCSARCVEIDASNGTCVAYSAEAAPTCRGFLGEQIPTMTPDPRSN